jgi:uncharacterized phage protein gp47/JayE
VKSYEETVAAMESAFAQAAGYSPDEASDLGIRMRVLAGEIYSLQNAVEWLKMQAFPQTAQGEQLDLHAQQRGIARKPALAAQGSLTFRRATPLWYDAAIPAGTVCSTGGEAPVRYVTTQAAELPAGALSVQAAAQAETPGKTGNALPGTVTVMVTPPPALESVTNEAAFSGGTDAEGDSELRARLMRNCSGAPNGTNEAFYREYALGFDGVYSAGVLPMEHGAGTVGIYLGARGTVPNEQTVAQVQASVNAVKEINVQATVAAAQTVSVPVDVAVTPAAGVTATEAQQACREAVTDYFENLCVGEAFLTAALGVCLMSTGKIKNYCFNSAVSSDRGIARNQLAVCGTVGVTDYAEVQG